MSAAANDGIDNTGGFDNVKVAHGTVQQFRQAIANFDAIHLVKSDSNKIAHDAASSADKNVNLGIFAAPGNLDGGANHAKKNGTPAQCVGVACH